MGFLENVKSGWGKAVKKSGEIAEVAVKKGGEIAGVTKLNVNLKTAEYKLDRMYCQLGKLCYEKADEAAIAAQILDIDEITEGIAAIKAEIAEKSGKIICTCGKEVDSEVSFCPYCGTKLEKKNLTTDDDENLTTEEDKKEEPSTTVSAEANKPLTADGFIAFFVATMEKYHL